MAKKIEPPGGDAEKMLNDVIVSSIDRVLIPHTKKSYNIRWLRMGTRRKITQIMLNKKGDEDILYLYKVSACVILNGYWKIKFLYPFLWRYLAYIKQYGEHQLEPLLEKAKKKVPVQSFLLSTISAIDMKDTTMTMTKKEVEVILQERRMGQPTQQEKKESG